MVKKIPFIQIPIQNLELDLENPRITLKGQISGNENNILKEMYNKHSLKDLALSMQSNGYLNIESIVVMPKILPKNFEKITSGEELKKIIEEKIKKGEKFVVLEGNRRISTAKLILNKDLRDKLGIKNTVFDLDQNKLKTFEKINTICYFNRSEVSAFIGVRHINSNLKWSSFAKAKYIFNRINELKLGLKDEQKSIKILENEIGDATVMIKRFYFCYRITQEAKDNFDFDITSIVENFSYLTTAMNYSTFRNYIGINLPVSKIIFSDEQLIKNDFIIKFEQILTWIFGNIKKGKKALINESRDISNKLSPILANDNSTRYLIDTNDINGAFDFSDGEKKFIIKNLNTAISNLENVKKIIWKQEDQNDKEDFSFKLNELEQLIYSIKKDLKND